MKLLDRSFECLLGFAVLLVLALVLLHGAREIVLSDTHGHPLGVKTRVECPGCARPLCIVNRYPEYRCWSCGGEYRIEFASRKRGDRYEAVRVSTASIAQ